METTLSTIGNMFKALPFSGSSWFVICTLLFFIILFARASRNPRNPVRWEHLVIDSINDRASPYKVGYLIGVMVSTWIVIHLSDGGTLSLDIFGSYLVFLMGGAGMNSYANVKKSGHRHGGSDDDDGDDKRSLA